MRHAFVDSGATRAGKDGRLFKVCGECGQINIGTAHIKHGAVPHTVRKDKPLTIVPREVRILALALDAVLAMPLDAVGWRTYVRATDLRAAITDVPRDPETVPIVIPKYEPVEERQSQAHKAKVARARQSTKGIRHQFMREVANAAIEQGWQLEKTGTGHYRLGKDGRYVVFASSASDSRAWRNMKAQAKRYGINVEGIG